MPTSAKPQKMWSVFRVCPNNGRVAVLRTAADSPMKAVHMAIMKMYRDSNNRMKTCCPLYAQTADRKQRSLKPHKYVHCRVKDNKPFASRADNKDSLPVAMRKVHKSKRGCSGRGRKQTRKSHKSKK